MPSPKRTSTVLSCLGVTVLGLVSACSPTPVDASPAVSARAAACTTVATKWPKKVGHLGHFPVTTSSASVRAWGEDTDSALVARCGVQSPGPTTDACLQVDDVDWIQTPIRDGYRFVTYGRSPALEVLVPKKASTTPGMLLPAFTAAAKTVSQGSHRCD